MTEQNIDTAREVRAGEMPDIEKLNAYLSNYIDFGNDMLEVRQFPSGFSNLTYLIKIGEKEFVMRRPPFGAENIEKGHDMGREYKVLELLRPVFDKVPKPVVFCEDPSVIGAPFYLMERVKGIILRSEKDFDCLDATTVAKLYECFIDNFADLHSLDIYQTGLIQLGKPEGYLERQVNGWTKRYYNSKTEEISEMNFCIQWLDEKKPASPAATFLHNDYKFDNIILNTDNLTQIKAILDWEMSTVGDPYTDLGIVLSYTAEQGDPVASIRKFFGGQVRPGALSRIQLVERYEEKTGKKVKNLPFYYAFALFKLGVVLQQIYYRYHKGFTKDERFAPLIHIVKDCVILAKEVIQAGKISGF